MAPLDYLLGIKLQIIKKIIQIIPQVILILLHNKPVPNLIILCNPIVTKHLQTKQTMGQLIV